MSATRNWIGRAAFAAAFLGASVVASGTAVAAERLLVFAAASLKNALDEIAVAYEAQTGQRVVISYAGSSALARQIEQGAPADIFISADLDWMTWLSDRGLTDKATETALLGNRLVLVAPAGSNVTAKIAPGFDLAALLGDGRLAVANTEAVPAGRYAKAALETLGVWNSVSDKLAQAENVRAALALVSTGEAPLGIVYRTDANADPQVRILDMFSATTHPPIVYPAAILSGSENPDAAALIEFLHSDAAHAHFEAHGFEIDVPQIGEGG
ncbi:MAG: molybdate ABC transporter substrate-binding protein [Rhizobiaceae bacterium]